MSNGKFYSPEQVRPLYPQIARIYQVAFAGEPWNEVSKCPDNLARCAGGLSSVAVGSQCTVCKLRPTSDAYEAEELARRFDQLAGTRPTSWYIEGGEDSITLCAVAWLADSRQLAREKYMDVPDMKDWLGDRLGASNFVWLDEVFADRKVRPRGNLKNFVSMCDGFGRRLGSASLAYRTIAPQMTSAARKLSKSAICERNIDVPDRRDFVQIDLGEEMR